MKLNNLEKSVERTNPDKRKLPPNRIDEIIDSYGPSKGNANHASKRVGHPPGTIIRCWRKAGLEIRTRGMPKGIRDENKRDLIRNLILEGNYQSQIARKLGVSRQAIDFYRKHYNLPKPVNEIQRRKEEKYNLVKQLIGDGLIFEEIVERLGTASAAFYCYLQKHPGLTRPKTKNKIERELKREKVFELIKNGLLEGLSQKAIAEREHMHQTTVGKYVNRNSQLRKIYDEKYGKVRYKR